MSRHWRAPRHGRQRDENEPLIVEALEAAGYSVTRIDVPCDLIVGKAGRTHLVEVKRAKGKQTGDQKDFARIHRGDYHLVRSATDALEQLRDCGRQANGSADGRMWQR